MVYWTQILWTINVKAEPWTLFYYTFYAWHSDTAPINDFTILWTRRKQFLFFNRYLLKLQTEEIQIHAEEMSNLRKELEDEREDRLDLQDRFLKPNATSDLSLAWAPSRRRNGKHGTKSEEDIVSDLRRQVCSFLRQITKFTWPVSM